MSHWSFVDRTEQPLIQVQKDLEQMLGTALLNGDIRMQRVRDHLTVVITERLLFDVGSHEIKSDGIEVLKHMGVLFKTAPLKEIRVAGHADRASTSDRSNKYFEKLALSKARARSRVSLCMNKFRKLGFIDYNDGLDVHSSLLTVVLHD